MGEFYVEEENFLEDLKSKKYVQLNEEGIEKVVKIIEEKDNVIDGLEQWLITDLQEVYRDAGHRHNIIVEVLDKLQGLKGENDA